MSTALVVVHWRHLRPLTDLRGRPCVFPDVDAARDAMADLPDRSAWGLVSLPVECVGDVRGWLVRWMAGAEERYQERRLELAAARAPLESEAVPA